MEEDKEKENKKRRGKGWREGGVGKERGGEGGGGGGGNDKNCFKDLKNENKTQLRFDTFAITTWPPFFFYGKFELFLSHHRCHVSLLFLVINFMRH